MKLQDQLALAGRYIRTLRHLRFSQLRGQMVTRFKKLWRDPAKILAGKLTSWKLSLLSKELDLCPPVPAQDAEALSSGTFCFINQTADLGFPVDWSAKRMPRLWSYNLHYFDWLWSLLYAADDHWERAKDLTLDWIKHHSPTKEACGWEPYPTSLRLMNWCLLYGLKHKKKLAKDSAFRDILLDSIGRQVAWLERNLETHVQANHLLENLCALVCVTSVLKGPDCIRLQKRYRSQFVREIQEQILPDGMHYERSPMYHLRVMWLMEMLKEVGDSGIGALVEDPLNRAKVALVRLRHPDGEIAQFNDAAIGVYADLWPMQAPDGAWSLPEAGYYGYRRGGDYLVIDSGAIGPDHQPGHAHADLFSFELSLAGTRVITDTGISTYEVGTMRAYDRSTAAHNTVEVAGENSVEVWGSFRVGRRVRPKILRWKPSDEGILLEAEHYGYRHHRSKAIHRRTFEWTDRDFIISDKITIREAVNITGRIHLDPNVRAKLEGRRVFCLTPSGINFEVEVKGPGELSLDESLSSKYFGKKERRQVVTIRATALPPLLSWTWRLTQVL